MVLPIYAYGNSVLREKGITLEKDHPGLQDFIDNMFETMYDSSGVGLASQQVGKAYRLFIVDASPFATGANVTPQLPINTVVTPCHDEGDIVGSK